uniref:Uncharacterized protein n=1 Tax=Cannabis sativa TaxID=3483 RepID=A0A803QQI8_CANSA
MSQKVFEALKKRSGDSFSQVPSAKRSKVDEVLPKEKSTVKSPIDYSEEVVSKVEPLVKKSYKSKGAKANLEGNFDYLSETKEAYLSYCVAQKDKEDLEAANPTASFDPNTDALATDDQVNPYKESGTPTV